jgi:death on curing protein
MNYLDKEIVNRINQATVKEHGGNFNPPNNYLHEDNLDYLIEAVQGEMFGEEIYPTIGSKAALYMFSIISNHIYSDGNKRTGLEAGILFLRINGKNISNLLPNEALFDFTIKVASGECTLEECTRWFEENIVKEYL